MASTSARPATRVQWAIQPVTVAGLTLTLARLEVRLHLAAASPGPQTIPGLAWLDTGAPLSVVPFHIHQQALRWQSIPGIRATWAGRRCDLGWIDVWLPTDRPPSLHGPLPLLAKFPRSDPPGDDVPILLGLEFFLSHQAQLQLLLPPQHGSILFP
jgi:hypothetical protein